MLKVMPDYGTSLFSELVKFVLDEQKKTYHFYLKQESLTLSRSLWLRNNNRAKQLLVTWKDRLRRLSYRRLFFLCNLRSGLFLQIVKGNNIKVRDTVIKMEYLSKEGVVRRNDERRWVIWLSSCLTFYFNSLLLLLEFYVYL